MISPCLNKEAQGGKKAFRNKMLYIRWHDSTNFSGVKKFVQVEDES